SPMPNGDSGPSVTRRARVEAAERDRPVNGQGVASGWVIEAVGSPFHCLYQDALYFHTQSQLRLARAETESGRPGRAAFLLYMASAEALIHQAAVELGRPELTGLAADPHRPLPLSESWRLLPAVVAEAAGGGGFDPEAPPWPQFAELLALHSAWAYP